MFLGAIHAPFLQTKLQIMAQTPVTPLEPIAPPPDEAPRARSSWLPHILVGVFVAGVVAIECAAAYVLLPSQDNLQQWVEERIEQDSDLPVESEEAATGTFEDDGRPTSEFDLGEFAITAFQPVANTTLRIDFHLWGTIYEEDASDLQKRLDVTANRVRDQVIATVRGSEVTDLTDAGWGLLKRKILDKTNRILGRQLIQDVVFSEFFFIEQ